LHTHPFTLPGGCPQQFTSRHACPTLKGACTTNGPRTCRICRCQGGRGCVHYFSQSGWASDGLP
jgi:hypothetical protein